MAETSEDPNSSSHLLRLPVEIISKIFSYTSYEQIGKMRSVCKLFNDVGSVTLNSTFSSLQKLLHARFQQIKCQMPRRESSRRNHPLAREWEIVETVHMRLSLLEMTFGKHIERKNCCFFAGEILDEVFRIYHYVTSNTNLGRAYRVTDELFELTTMATEYFRESIEPTLPDIIYFSSDLLSYASNGLGACAWKSPSSSSTSRSSSNSWANVTDDDKILNPPSPNGALKKRIKRLRQGMKKNNSRLAYFKRELKSSATQMGDQQRQLIEYSARLEDFDKKFEENARKFSSLFQELNKCKTELQYLRSKSPANQLCFNCSSVIGLPNICPTPHDLVSKDVEEQSKEDDLSRYFIGESSHESPSLKNNCREFMPIPLKDVENDLAVPSTSKQGIVSDLETEDKSQENNECDAEPAAKRRKKSLVKRLIE